MLRNVEDCYRDGESVRNLFVRPNQVFLTNANRADVFFKAPVDAAGKVYTILAQEFLLHTDNFHQRLQVGVASGRSGFSAGNPRRSTSSSATSACRRAGARAATSTS